MNNALLLNEPITKLGAFIYMTHASPSVTVSVIVGKIVAHIAPEDDVNWHLEVVTYETLRPHVYAFGRTKSTHAADGSACVRIGPM